MSKASKQKSKLKESQRDLISEKEFDGEVSNVSFEKYVFRNVSAVERIFTKVTFNFVIFDDCYFRNCKFIDCHFIGAQFKGSSFRGSEFPGSKFDYARFSNTIITTQLIERNLPGYENVALEFAQGLRVNFGQIGDVRGVNKAIIAELAATKVHLKKAAWSRESWYREKYRGLARLRSVGEHLSFWCFDFTWGNGESLFKLSRFILLTLVLLAITVWTIGTPIEQATAEAISLFIGVSKKIYSYYLAEIAFVMRYLLFGMFVSVLVKRLSRR